MPREMYRGKQQILYNYLPNRTFDFAKVAAIARVVSIRGEPRTDLNAPVLLRRIGDEIREWPDALRPSLRDSVLNASSNFTLVEPRTVQSELYPKVLWCQNKPCGRVINCQSRDDLPKKCPTCRTGTLVQLRFVKVHLCGALQPLLPPSCDRCGNSVSMALDTRGSERVSSFRWICRRCNTAKNVIAGYCTECTWPDKDKRQMLIQVHRAGRTFYAHNTVLLNIPTKRLEPLFRVPEWQALTAARYLHFPEIGTRTLTELATEIGGQIETPDSGLSGTDLDELIRQRTNGEITDAELLSAMQNLRQRRQAEKLAISPNGILQTLIAHTGVPWGSWENAGQEILESIMPTEMGHASELDLTANSPEASCAKQLGLGRLSLVSDYPIVTATYGFSRVEYRPGQCQLNPFPGHHDHGGKYPIFVDQVQADALLIELNHRRVLEWLRRNGCAVTVPAGSNRDASEKAYFVQLFDGVSLREKIHANQRNVRMVFSLLHSLSHLSIRQAALLCGLDRTSLSEYLLPRTLTFAVYCNHRFGATIGALTALFEQSLPEWLRGIQDTKRCVYDPVCREDSGNCHACTHLAETSCRVFNLNLSRAFLFGGRDDELGDIPVGYFDNSLP